MPMKDEFGRQGLSHKHNRVTFPTFSAINHTYKKLPQGYTVGMISEIENLGLKAVLCKAGTAGIANKWLLVESHQRWSEDADLPSAAAKGQNKVTINTSATFTKDELNGGYLWIVGGTGLAEDGAGANTQFRKLLISGNPARSGAASNIAIELAGNLPVNLDTTTDIIVEGNMFAKTGIGTATPSNKALGLNFLVVPADEYYWAIFFGDVPADVGSATVGQTLMKAASGKLAAATSSNERLGRVKHAGAIDIITLDIPGIDPQYSQAVDLPAA